MINDSLKQSYSLYCPYTTYSYTPLCELNYEKDSDDQSNKKRPGLADNANDQQLPSVSNSRKRFKETPTSSLTPITSQIPKAKTTIEMHVPRKSRFSVTTASDSIDVEVDTLDENWHNEQRTCLKKLETLKCKHYKKWESYDKCWENIELYQYEHYEKIYLAQRQKLQKQIRSVLNDQHPDLMYMEYQHNQSMQDLCIRMASENVSADEMCEWEKKTIDNETKSTIKNLDNELLNYLQEKKRLLLIENDMDTNVPGDLLSLYEECGESQNSIKQHKKRLVLIKQDKQMNSKSIDQWMDRFKDRNTNDDLTCILNSIAEL